jgi:hypothetical protein
VAFVFSETAAFLRQAWWLALAAALPNLTLYALWYFPMPWDGAANIWIAGAVLALANVALTYWVVRFIALNHDVSKALEVNGDSVRTFLPYAVVAFALIWLSVSLASIASGPIGIVLRLLPELLYFFAPWALTAPSGSAVVGPIGSLKLVAPHLGWAIGLLVLLLLLYALFAILLGVLLPARAALMLLNGSSLVGAIVRAMLDIIWDVAFISATCALALRTGIRVSGAERLRTVFE